MTHRSPVFEDLLEQPVAVLGAGLSGRAAAEALERRGYAVVIYDRDSGRGTVDDFSPKAAAEHRLCIVSPGFAEDHPWLVTARKQGCVIRSELWLGRQFWKGKIIGVTGTNGKTTLTRLLAHAFSVAGFDAQAVGNVGLPLCAIVDDSKNHADSIAVCEISSFQAESSQELHLNGLIWTNFAEDHLDRYASMEAYFAAKAWLFESLVFEAPVIAGESVFAFADEAKINLPISVERAPKIARACLPPAFRLGPRGETFHQGAALWQALGLSLEHWREAASSFQFDRHRLEFCGEQEGVRFWNDSKATNFHACLAAVDGIEGPIFWIGGGRSKGGDLDGFAEQLSSDISAAYIVCADPEAISRSFTPFMTTKDYDQLDSAVNDAYLDAMHCGGGDVLFSPAFSSLDQYDSFADRGDAFVDAVRRLDFEPTHRFFTQTLHLI
ncbi:MAG: NAD(P)-binding protein [Opitutales bacterium]|nr:NAD(P)-binding protein [Opitutales bacterium]NRA27516.1 NAD(P)-binding protein [Opitutales bacterium]